MAELGSGSGTGFPAALDANSKLEYDKESGDRTIVRADVPNDLAAAMVAVQTELGTDPAGSKTDVKSRLAVSIANDGYIGKVRYKDQYSTLAAAIADLPTAGGQLKLSAGTETIPTASDEGTSVKTKSHIEGSGYNSLVISETGKTRGFMLPDADCDGISYENLRMDGQNSLQATNSEQYPNIDLSYKTAATRASNYSRVAHVWSNNSGGDGIHMRNNWYTDIHGAYIDVNYQEIGTNLRGRNGIAHVYGDHLVIANAIIRRAGNAGIDLEPALTGEYVKKVTISNCVISESLYGIALVGLSLSTGMVEEVCISNCVIKVGDKSAATGFNSPTMGIVMANVQNVSLSNVTIVGQTTITKSGVGIGLTNCKNIKMHNVTAKGCSEGCNIDYTSGAKSHSIQIIGGEFSGNYNQGIKLIGDDVATVSYGNNFTVQGAFVYNNSQIGAGQFSGIQVDYMDYGILMGNHCYDDQGGSATQAYGITINRSRQTNLIGNIAYGNATGAYQVYSAVCTNFDYGHNYGTIVWS